VRPRHNRHLVAGYRQKVQGAAKVVPAKELCGLIPVGMPYCAWSIRMTPAPREQVTTANR
jgi:hypothetical protein